MDPYLVFNISLLVLIQMNLEKTGSIKTETDPLSYNFCRVHKIIKDSTVNGNEGTAAWSLLLLLVHFSSGLGKNPPLGDEDDMLARELLL